MYPQDSIGREDEGRGFRPARRASRLSRLRNRIRRRVLGMAPVEIQKLGHVHFLVDGGRRVSVARWRGMVAVDAVVTEFV